MTRFCAQTHPAKNVVCNHNPLNRLGGRLMATDGFSYKYTHSTRRKCQLERIQTRPRAESQTHSSSQSSFNKEGNRSKDVSTGRNIVVAVDASEVSTKRKFRRTVLLSESFAGRPTTNHPFFPLTPTGFCRCFQMDCD